ncbi:MAG: RloB family protein [Bacteroidia bacterium]
MKAAWDVKTDDSRKEEITTRFIIFCEDKVGECEYFKSLENYPYSKVLTVGEQGSNHKNIIKAITYCDKESLFDYDNNKVLIPFDADKLQVWCVYDKDTDFSIHATKDTLAENNTAFNISIQTAKTNGIQVAWSNDAFELWILLHFEDVAIEASNRTYYYNRLTEIAKLFPIETDNFKELCAKEKFSYKKYLKFDMRFKAFVLPQLKDKTHIAIQRAIALENHHTENHGNTNYHLHAPATRVHYLVQELLRLGKQQHP